MSALKTVTVSRRTFLKRLGAGAAAATLAPLALAQGPWVRAQQPFLIGMANPLATYFGEAAEKALRLAINEINDQGGILGQKLDLIVSDSAGPSSSARS